MMWELLAIIYPLITLIAAFIKLKTFKYYVLDQSLIIEFGLFKKEKINIPFKKITSVNIEERFLHQPFNLGLMKIETAGSNKTEGEIPSLELNKAIALKEYILNHSVSDHQVVETIENPPLLRMSSKEVLIYGITNNHLMTSIWVIGIAWVYFWRLREVFGKEWVNNITTNYIFHWQNLSFYLLFAMVVFIIAIFVSVIRNFLRFEGFTLYQDTLSYQYKAGLIDKRNHIIPYKKLQFLRVKTNWWRKKWNIYTISLRQTQGGRGEKQNSKTEASFPVFSKERYIKFLNTYYKDLSETSSANKIHFSYWIRLSIFPIIITFLAFIAFSWYYKTTWMLLGVIPIILYQIIANMIFVKKYRYFINEDALQIESGLWGKKIELIQWKNVQNVIITQTILQRRKNLCNIQLVTASGLLRIPYLKYQDALNVQHHIIMITAQSSKSWN